MIRSRLQVLLAGSARPAARLLTAAALLAGLAVSGCSDSSGPGGETEVRYAQDVQPVLNANCLSMGCHNSADRAESLSLVSYESLAEGSAFGAVVLPYYPERSHLWLHTSGAVPPQMPLDRDPLPAATIDLLGRWIHQGAKDDAGIPMYSDVVRKAFVACQGENAVAVVDMDTGLAVRLIEVDAPHSVYVDPMTRRLYVSRLETASDNIRVYDADTYAPVMTGRAGTFPALMEVVRPAGQPAQLWVTNFDTDPNGDQAVRVLNPETLEQIASFELGNVQLPHGLAVTADQTRIYVTNIGTDNVTVFGTDPPGVVQPPIPLPDAGGIPQQPQQCVLSDDEQYLFVSALGTDKVYVMRTDGDSLAAAATIDVGDGPWHLTVHGDALWVADWLGSAVSVVDVHDPENPGTPETLQPYRSAGEDEGDIPVLQRPIGISFTPDGSQVYVTSANDDGTGSGHHPAPEGEKNPGNVAIFDAGSHEVLSVAEVPNFARWVSFLP